MNSKSSDEQQIVQPLVNTNLEPGQPTDSTRALRKRIVMSASWVGGALLVFAIYLIVTTFPRGYSAGTVSGTFFAIMNFLNLVATISLIMFIPVLIYSIWQLKANRAGNNSEVESLPVTIKRLSTVSVFLVLMLMIFLIVNGLISPRDVTSADMASLVGVPIGLFAAIFLAILVGTSKGNAKWKTTFWKTFAILSWIAIGLYALLVVLIFI